MDTQISQVEDLVTENKRLREKLKKLQIKERNLQVINDFATSLLLQNTVDEIVWDIAKNAVARLEFEDCVVYLTDESGEYLIQKAAHGPKNPVKLDILNPIRIKIGEGIVGTVAKTGIAEVVKDTRHDARYIVDDESRLSEIAVPIITSGNKIIGVIDSENPKPNFYTNSDLAVLKTIASMAAAHIIHAKTKENLERSNKDLEQFAYVASHDLQEPLRMIGSYAQLLEKRYKDSFDEQGNMFLHYLTDGAKRMNALVRDLLAYAKFEPNKNITEVIDCKLVIRQVLSNLNVSIEENKAKIEVGKMPEVRAEFSHLVQLFQNLVSNALKFRSEKRPHIQINCEEHYAEFRFRISDNGIGISEEHHHKVFSIFKRLHSRRDYEGTGIGLAVCKKIVENLGGNIWVKSLAGVGSTFFFTIPK